MKKLCETHNFRFHCFQHIAVRFCTCFPPPVFNHKFPGLANGLRFEPGHELSVMKHGKDVITEFPFGGGYGIITLFQAGNDRTAFHTINKKYL